MNAPSNLHKIILIGLLLSLFSVTAFSQSSVGINTTNPNPNAVLQLVSPNNNQGILIPSLTTLQRTDAIFVSSLAASDNGLLIYDSDIKSFFYWDGTAWSKVSNGVPTLDEVLSNSNSAASQRIIDLANPTLPQDAATKKYIDDSLVIVNSHISNLFDSISFVRTDISNLYDSITNINTDYSTIQNDIINLQTDVTSLFDSVTNINTNISNLYDSVTNINTDITSLQTDVTNIDARVTTAETNITSLQTDVTNLYDSVTNINVNIGNLYDSVTNINTNISNLYDSVTNINTDITSLQTDVTNIDARVTTAETNITAIQTDVTNLYDSVTNINTNISNLYDSVTNINTDITSLQTDVTNIDARVTTAETNITALQTDVTNLYDSVTNINVNIGNLYDSVTNINTNISNLYDSVTNINTDITSLQTDVTNIDARVTTAETNITTLQTDVTNLYDSVTNINVNIGNLYDSVTNINTNISNLYDSVTNINNSISILEDSVNNFSTNISNLFDSVNNISNQVTNLISNPTFALPQGQFFVGDVNDTARATAKNTIPLSGFGNAEANVSMGDGVTNYRITNLLDPVNPQDAATKQYVADAMAGAGLGDMLKATYDANNNGIVNNSELVNGLTVQTAVPAGAVFTDAQDLSLAANTLSLTNDGTTVSLAPYLDNTDAQTLSIAANSLSITGGNSVSLAPYLDNTDAQDLTLAANTLSLTGDASTVSLAPYLDNTDAQTLSIAANSLSITGGNSVSLAPYLDNTDAQDLTLTGNTLALTNDASTIDLSSYLDNTDNQTLSNVLALGNNAGGVRITNLLDPVNPQDAATKQYVLDEMAGAGLGDMLKATYDANNNGIVNNSELVNGLTVQTAVPAGAVFTDAQDLSLAANTLSLTNDGTTVNLAPYLDNTDAQNISISGNAVSISGGTGFNLSNSAPGANEVLTWDGTKWDALAGGTVTSASVVSANGFAGTVATAGTTPAITLTTSVTGLVKGNGTALSAAVAGTDYVAPNAAIVAGTNTKITYDTKGLVTAGTAATLASADFANQGTTTGVLHGNAAGNPSWGQIVNADITNATINLTTKVTGTLPIANGGTNNGALGVTNGGIVYTDGTKLMNSGVGTSGQVLTSNGAAAPTWTNAATGTVTTASVVTANGFAGTVANAGTTPAITLTTSVNGLVKGNGTALSAAVAGTDYTSPTDVHYVGTTSIANNRASASQALTGITSIDGTASGWTTARNLAGNSVNGTANVAFANKFIVQGTADAGLSGAQFLGSLGTGIVKNTTTTGVLSIATAGTDYVAPNGAIVAGTGTKITYDTKGLVTAGTSAVLASADFVNQGTTTGVLHGNAAGNPSWGQIVNNDITNATINLTTKVTGTLPIANGGTNNGALAVTNGGVVYTDGTKLMNSGAGTAGQVLISNGAGAPTWGADANTTYTAGEGLDLSSTTFSIKGINSLSDDNVPRWDEAANEFQNSSIWDDDAGHVHIGNSTISTSYALQVTGAFKTSKIYHSSDARWKKNILPIDNALSKVQRLQGVTYEWRTDEFPNQSFSKGTQIGLIAQEVEKVLPELVITDETGYKAVEYANVVAVLIEAIKEQQKIIDSQKLEISKLNSSNSEMQSKIESLQTMQVQINTLEKQMKSMEAMLQILQPTATSTK